MATSTLDDWCARLGISLATLLLSLIAFGIPDPPPKADEVEVVGMMYDECHAIWKDLYNHRIVAGDDVEDLILRIQPSTIDRNGEETTLAYFKNYAPRAGGFNLTGLTVIARHGKLVAAYASSCEWTMQFFDNGGFEKGFFSWPFRRLPQGGAIMTWETAK
jgi:hypothetical protein